mmetsp:Transcript_22592/g.40668  ORF Transcript_22592/g.40668 Transcript_22592/m.40668 type:complete len:312 (-) Transcript_22592:43-978(-)
MEEPSRRPREGCRQRNFKVWRMPVSYPCASICYFIVFALCISLGIAIIDASNKIVTASKRYDDKGSCEKASKHNTVTCDVVLEVEEDMEGPVYFYVEMRNYFQNHRIYSKSRDYTQLSGDDVSEDELTNCGDYTTLGDLYFDLGQYPVDKEDREDDDLTMNPCGLIARSYMNDTFKFIGTQVELEDDDIAWSTDDDVVYSNTDDWEEKQWIDIEQDWFKVWMRVAAFSNFRKLRYVIDDDIDEGDYVVRITSNYDVGDFDGEKHIFMSTTSPFAGKATTLGGLFIATGAIAFLESMLCLVLWVCGNKKGGA